MCTESALLYLTSASPRRRELLEQIGVVVQVDGLPLMETASLLAGFGIRCWQPR